MEEKHIQDALKTCQYPQWAIDKEAKPAKRKETEQKRKNKPTNQIEDMVVVTLPYIRGVTELIQRTMRTCNINAPVKPHTKLPQLLVHPKDKIKTCNVLFCRIISILSYESPPNTGSQVKSNLTGSKMLSECEERVIKRERKKTTH